jgi:hypothetical protein
MDLHRILAELARERELIDQAIAHLERLPLRTQAVSRSPRRSREDKPQEKARAAGAAFD